MKHANYARTRATTLQRAGKLPFNSVGPDRATRVPQTNRISMIYLIMEYRARIKKAYTPTEALKATLQANWHKMLLATILAVSNHRASCKIKISQAQNLFPERFCKGKVCFCLIDFH